jgi:hypothetical protein
MCYLVGLVGLMVWTVRKGLLTTDFVQAREAQGMDCEGERDRCESTDLFDGQGEAGQESDVAD